VTSLLLWRLCAAKYGPSAYSGEGAELYGGRWSPAGLSVAYCSESRALAVVEVLANADEADRLFALKWVLVPAEVPADLIERPARFPGNWRQYPHPPTTQAVGAEWARAQRSVGLRVPSAVVPGEFNYLLNPKHPQFPRVKVGRPEPFAFDPRLRPPSPLPAAHRRLR
jgi:RES domain-containing protein